MRSPPSSFLKAFTLYSVNQAVLVTILYPISFQRSVRQPLWTGWGGQTSYEALAEFIKRDYDGLKDAVALLMDGGRLRIDSSTYQNDMTTFSGRDDVFSLLVHLGYLGFDDETEEVFIPNKEILDEFKTSTKSKEWMDTFLSFEMSVKLLKATWNKDSDKVAELVEIAHNNAANRTYHNESALSYGIQLAYYAARKYDILFFHLIPHFRNSQQIA